MASYLFVLKELMSRAFLDSHNGHATPLALPTLALNHTVAKAETKPWQGCTPTVPPCLSLLLLTTGLTP